MLDQLRPGASEISRTKNSEPSVYVCDRLGTQAIFVLMKLGRKLRAKVRSLDHLPNLDAETTGFEACLMVSVV
jgi:hypothetical protein